jgi:cation:H+ antiporter
VPSQRIARSRGKLTAIGLALAATVPGLVARIAGLHPEPWIAAALYGLAVVGSAFILAWAAEVVQLDVSQGLALALLALIAVLPEYAVDFVFSWKAGKDPHQYAPLALANMTGGNRLLIGVGWSLVVLLAAWRMRRIADRGNYQGEIDTEVHLERTHSIEIAFLLVATVYSLTLPFKHTITLFDSAVLITIFVLYLWRLTRAPADAPDLVGPAELIGSLPQRTRRILIVLMFVFAAAVILLCADNFAESLVETGTQLGVSKFLLVQWLAPLASEAPELIVAGLFAWRLNTEAAMGALISSKVNQWTLLVGSLPIVFAISAGALHGLPLDSLQREELLLTAAQSVFAVAVLADRKISVKEALALLGLFLLQFVLGAALPGPLRESERLIVSGIYFALAAWIFFKKRHILPALLHDGLRTPVRELSSQGPTGETATAAGDVAG